MVLAGRTWDMTDDSQPVMWSVPARGNAYGRICFGRHAGCEDGMNDHGLFVAVAATPPDGTFESHQRPIQCPAALDLILARCANVDEAVAWWEKYTNPAINSTVRRKYSVLGIRMGRYVNSGVGGHILMADKGGKSVVCEWVKGKLRVIRKTHRHQIITNFLLSNPKLGNSPCPRLQAVTRVLDSAQRPALRTCVEALKESVSKWTKYSVVYDLSRGGLHVYCRGDFQNVKVVDLQEELQKGAHEVNLYAWFGFSPAAR